MLFHTLNYLVFLLLVVTLFWGVPRRFRLWVLGLSSLGFYALASRYINGATGWIDLRLILAVACATWAGALFLHRTHGRNGRWLRNTGVILTILAPLLFYKYWNFIAENIEALATLLGADLSLARNPRGQLDNMYLPIGISFFTFQALAYVIDTNRSSDDPKNSLGPEPKAGHFWTFLAFFPQLIAGPIVRRHELMPQIKKLGILREHQVGAGVYRILRGCLKKAVIADPLMNLMVNPVFEDIPTSEMLATTPSIEVILALYAFTVAIYYDFSGYTDIAIGSARVFGIELPENFNRPYKATSVAEFWRRWHITLSNWVRDYIYYPLGGSRTGKEWRVYFNILVTMLVIALWHGASWNFVIYGCLHGTLVGINRWQRKRSGRRPGDALPHWWAWFWRWILTFHFIVAARILFVSEDLERVGAVLQKIGQFELMMPRFQPLELCLMAVGLAIHFTPTGLSSSSEAWFKRQNPVIWAFFAACVGAGCMLSQSTVLTFVYYDF